MTRLRGLLTRHWFAFAFALLTLALLLRNLADLSGSPPGLYSDEASIGYNAWAIAHHGVDEHGYRLPLYFEAFGEYKNPVYIYALVPFVWLFGVTSAVIRTPAALFGAITCVSLAWAALQLTRRRSAALMTLIAGGVVPWLTLESRLGFEVISMVACLGVFAACLSRATREGASWRWFLAAGCALAISTFGYSVGRLETGLLAAALLVCFGYPWRRWRGWWTCLIPVGLGYVTLLIWNLAYPGALLARFNVISITAGDPPLGTLILRFLGNYYQYFDPSFLLLHGDANERQATGFDGMLLLGMAPFIVIGIGVCLYHWRDGFRRWLLLALLAAPVSASLTNDGTPHSLRSVTMLPILLLLMALGADWLVGLWRQRLHLSHAYLVAAIAVLLLGEGYQYDVNLFAVYPSESGAWFDVGFQGAISYAYDNAHGHEVYLLESPYFDQPYIQAAVLLLPPPPSHVVTDVTGGAATLLAVDHMSQVNELPPLQPGVLVVAGAEVAVPVGLVQLTSNSAAVVYRMAGS